MQLRGCCETSETPDMSDMLPDRPLENGKSRAKTPKPAASPAVESPVQSEPSAPPAAKPAAGTLATKPKPTPNASLNGIAIEWGMIVQQNESIGGGITGLVMLVEDGVVIYRTIVAGSADYGVGKLDAMPAEELVAFELPPELRIVTTAARALTGARTHAIGRDGEKIQVGDIITDDAVTGVVTAAEDEAVIYRPLDDAQGNRFDPARRISANAHECRLVYRPEPAVSEPAVADATALDDDDDLHEMKTLHRAAVAARRLAAQLRSFEGMDCAHESREKAVGAIADEADEMAQRIWKLAGEALMSGEVIHAL